ncbi:DUF305 domain-containing protein [Gordonia neofelifaecis]|uniref:DUF305 domain-containing protein n=1 Tax=Gordonia neofelifaecis NRRL B-59395 TaxID=644548 RepID=F1YDR1_9ACTN|nr:DUF305 domain-containing protein [Gordonia neofelifaecis]EGD57001.1 hypothetical protein SCNU_01445 [Gordonia neofelifaecis NRRL B-59395]
MRTRLIVTAIAGAAVVVGVAACSPNEEPSDATHDMSNMSTSHDMSNMPTSAAASAEHNEADVMFAQMMLPHHEQALVMSDIILAKPGIPAQVTALAKQIKDAQGPEIAQLQSWLKEWGAPAQAPMDHEMDGMLSEEDLTKLRAAQGTDAAKLYLSQMIEHHEGAVDMAKDEIADGKNPDAIEMARSIVDSQQKEIDEMKAMLNGM